MRRQDIRRPFTQLSAPRSDRVPIGIAFLPGCNRPLYEGFAQPAMTYRPCAYWFWRNLQITIGGLEKQLDELNVAGFGAVQIFPGRSYGRRAVPTGLIGPAMLIGETTH